MKRIESDKEAINLITEYYNGSFETEEERDDILNKLEDYQIGISNILTQSKILHTPQEVLVIARERNKPILL